MLNLKCILQFFWIESKRIISKIILITYYHVNTIFNQFNKNLFKFFIGRKLKNIKSLFAFNVDLRKQDGAYGWLNYIIPNINQY